MDPVIRPGNGLLLMALQSAEGTAATPSAATDVIPCETDSVSYNGPFKTQAADEANGSFVASSPLVLGQPSTFSFRSRMKGANALYTSTVKPPLHAPLSAAGWLGQFTAAVSAAALAAGTTSSATLGTGAAATAQAYRGMPLVLTGAPAANRLSLITDYTAAKLATLADLYGSALSATNTGAIPANWTYAPTSPVDAATRATMHPAATIVWYEDGICYTWQDCRGTVDFEGNSAEPGYAVFNFTGIFVSKTTVALPSNPVYPSQSAPLLVMGVGGVQPAFQINRRGMPISKWSLKNGAGLESPDDPNTSIGFGAAQIEDRMPVLEIDPTMTYVATRDALADIAAFSQYPAAIQAGTVPFNRWSLTLPIIQPTDTTPALRGKMRSETLHYQATTAGKDAAGRDSDAILCFS
jgi:hypothetical protein